MFLSTAGITIILYQLKLYRYGRLVFGDDDLIQSCDNDGDDDDNDYYDVDVVGSGAILQDHITAI